MWAAARDFNGHAAWHPFIAESHIEDGLASDVVGCARNVTLDDRDTSLTSCIMESPLPIRDDHAAFRLRPVTEGAATFVE